MGRIADSVVALLAGGPLGPPALGEALAGQGLTRARDTAAAVRRAVRDDPRVLHLPDGRLASLTWALDGLELAVEVDAEAVTAGSVDVEPDLSPLSLLGVEPALRLPVGARAGDTVVVRVEDAATRSVAVALSADPPPARPADEAAVVAAVRAALAGDGDIVHLGTVVACAAAADPGLLRTPGRPLSAAVRDAGLEVHLGWVGHPGTAWAALTEDEVDAMEMEVAALLRDELTAAAASAQARLVALLARHMPERVPAARRHLARVLARGGRGHDALDVLRPALAEGDPENWYEAALIAYRAGDEVSARRWAESGLAHAEPGSDVAECLADMAGDLDAQATFLRVRGTLDEAADDMDAETAERVAKALVAPSRSYLVEGLAEELADGVGPDELPGVIAALAGAGEAGREALLALSAVLQPVPAAAAAEAAGRRARPRRAAVAGLLDARPSAAWATSPVDAPDQQQVVVAIAKEDGRVSPLVVLIDVDDLGGAVKDAFFLPDLADARLRRELFAPMEQVGLGPVPVDLSEAIAMVHVALARTGEIRWVLPSERHQPVLERIERWLLRPRGTGSRPVAGS
ncbi:MAG: hypothetical protein AB7O53_13495 [Thermoleophilia bacterium]